MTLRHLTATDSFVLTILSTSWEEEESKGVGEGGAGRGALEVGVSWLEEGGGESL